jgi:hypothetical protein
VQGVVVPGGAEVVKMVKGKGGIGGRSLSKCVQQWQMNRTAPWRTAIWAPLRRRTRRGINGWCKKGLVGVPHFTVCSKWKLFHLPLSPFPASMLVQQQALKRPGAIV